MSRPSAWRKESHEYHRAVAVGQTMAADCISMDEIRDFARHVWPWSIKLQACCVLAAKRRHAIAAAQRTGQAYEVEEVDEVDLGAMKVDDILAPDLWVVPKTSSTH